MTPRKYILEFHPDRENLVLSYLGVEEIPSENLPETLDTLRLLKIDCTPNSCSVMRDFCPPNKPKIRAAFNMIQIHSITDQQFKDLKSALSIGHATF